MQPSLRLCAGRAFCTRFAPGYAALAKLLRSAPMLRSRNGASLAAIAALAFAGTASAAFADAPKVDWKKQEAEILQRHRELIQIDSSSPPGNETKVDDYLKQVLEAEGIPVKTFALNPRRGNLVARIKG